MGALDVGTAAGWAVDVGGPSVGEPGVVDPAAGASVVAVAGAVVGAVGFAVVVGVVVGAAVPSGGTASSLDVVGRG